MYEMPLYTILLPNGSKRQTNSKFLLPISKQATTESYQYRHQSALKSRNRSSSRRSSKHRSRSRSSESYRSNSSRHSSKSSTSSHRYRSPSPYHSRRSPSPHQSNARHSSNHSGSNDRSLPRNASMHHRQMQSLLAAHHQCLDQTPRLLAQIVLAAETPPSIQQ